MTAESDLLAEAFRVLDSTHAIAFGFDLFGRNHHGDIGREGYCYACEYGARLREFLLNRPLLIEGKSSRIVVPAADPQEAK